MTKRQKFCVDTENFQIVRVDVMVMWTSKTLKISGILIFSVGFARRIDGLWKLCQMGHMQLALCLVIYCGQSCTYVALLWQSINVYFGLYSLEEICIMLIYFHWECTLHIYYEFINKSFRIDFIIHWFLTGK